ncbi:hypothetical protein E2553_17005 [Paraburkholderia dipogonis]|uniref:Right-handed parallel beta-helix repeat-containing protein n=1 Tax=Paraburkholderia dipogonis TaxID=1211383 RepID=A0A4Y8N9W8_9BURK|nr:hypothetical protein [Paraburkholderia dipogonis]TFE46587.1 hypothetical protein E2553_17005 [Paraburkholderia dipogonis]
MRKTTGVVMVGCRNMSFEESTFEGTDRGIDMVDCEKVTVSSSAFIDVTAPVRALRVDGFTARDNQHLEQRQAATSSAGRLSRAAGLVQEFVHSLKKRG